MIREGDRIEPIAGVRGSIAPVGGVPAPYPRAIDDRAGPRINLSVFRANTRPFTIEHIYAYITP